MPPLLFVSGTKLGAYLPVEIASVTYLRCLLAAEHIPKDASSNVLVRLTPPLSNYMKSG